MLMMDDVGPDALDLAARHGLRLAVSRIGLDAGTFESIEGRRVAGELVARFRTHRGLWGYRLSDAVREQDAAGWGRVASLVREADPGHPFLASVLPADAWVGPALASGDYPGYLARFLQAVRPPVLHVALDKGDGSLLYETLEHARRAALDHGLPLIVTLRRGAGREPTAKSEAELRAPLYAALAYGARAVVWPGYWGMGEGGLVARDGTPSERLAWVAALNRELRTLGPELLRLRSAAVYHAGAPVPRGTTALPARALVGAVEGGAFLVALFEDERRAPYVLLVNKDAAKEAKARLVVQRVCRAVEAFDVSDGRWKELPLKGERFETTTELPLRPGDGKLLRLKIKED
jgi:hypothetical protein